MINLHTVYLQIGLYINKNPSAEYHVHNSYLCFFSGNTAIYISLAKVGLIISIIVFKIQGKSKIIFLLPSTVRESYIYTGLHGHYAYIYDANASCGSEPLYSR